MIALPMPPRGWCRDGYLGKGTTVPRFSVWLIALALALMVTGTAVAAPDDSGTQTMEVRFQEDVEDEEDDGFDWGILGLLGLAGLAGLLRRPKTEVRTTQTDTIRRP